MRAIGLGWLVCGVVVAVSASAWAHGGRPVPRKIYVDPDNSDNQALVSSDLGLHVTSDGGQSWFWICEDIVGFDVQTFALAGRSGGAPADRVWLAGGIGITDGVDAGRYVPGLHRSLDGGCNWAPTEGILATQWVSSISVDPDDPDKIVVTTRHLLEPNGIALSDDAGASWRWSNVEGLNRRLNSLTRAPSDPSILYASSTTELWRSEDGGQTWVSFFAELLANETDELEVLRVDPEDPDVLYFSLLGLAGKHLYVTDDGGLTPRKLLEPSGLEFQALSVTVTDDQGGRELLVGDTFGTAFLSTDLGQTWQEYLAGIVSIECLEPTPDDPEALFVCSNPFAQFIPPIFALGTTRDKGVTVEPYFSYADTTDYLQCDPDSQIQTVCVALLDVGGDDVGGGEDVGPDGPDAGSPDAGSPDAGSDDLDAGGLDAGSPPPPRPADCACATARGTAPAAPWWALGAILAARVVRRRGRRA